jgi:Bax protein
MNKSPDHIKIRPTANAVLVTRRTGDTAKRQKIFFGNLEVDRLNVQALVAVTMALIVGAVSTLLATKPPPGQFTDNHSGESTFFEVTTGEEMIGLLKENALWEIDGKGAVSPLLFASYPDNIEEFATSVRKRIFFHSLLPVALTALAEINRERLELANILAKIPGGYQQLTFSEDHGRWGRVLTLDEIEFIKMLTGKYRTNQARVLVNRIDLVPLSMILAQGAIESSWATSRFAQEGNNLFGVWTWGKKGMVPANRDDGEMHKVAMYDSILDSIRAYILNLNRLPAYRNFREIRKDTMDPLKLADGLLYYSQRGETYVWEVKNFITANNLRQYDKCFLVEKPIKHKEIKSLKLI